MGRFKPAGQGRQLATRDGSAYSGDVRADDVARWMRERPTEGSAVSRRFDSDYPPICRECWERWEAYQAGEVQGAYGVILEVREAGGRGFVGFRPVCGTSNGCSGCPQGGGS